MRNTSRKFIANTLLFAALAVPLNSYARAGSAPTGDRVLSQVKEGKAMGRMPTNKRPSRSGLPPVPEMWLAFESGRPSLVAVHLPQRAKNVLRDHWKQVCNYYYHWVRGKKTLETRHAVMVNVANASGWAIYKLMKLSINAPGGRRLITEGEAVDILTVLNRLAKDSVAPDGNSVGSQARVRFPWRRHVTSRPSEPDRPASL